MELNKLKDLLGISREDTSQDVSLMFSIDNVEEIITNYCHVESVPDGLTNTEYRMAIDLIRNENLGQKDAGLGSVSSITEGDTSTSFRSYADDNYSETLLKNYKHQLNRYRKVVF